MKLAMFAALALALTGVTLHAAADEAAAGCWPPNCILGYTCDLHEGRALVVEDPVTGQTYEVPEYSIVCYG